MPTPSLLIVPARFKTGRLYSQIPTSGAGDFTVTRNTAARRFDSAGLVASVASGIPRLDYYTSGGVTGCPALLVEPAATNLVSRSEEFNDAYWSKDAGVTVDSNVDVAPDGATTADRLNLTTNGAVYRSGFSLSGSHTFSIYLKGEGQNIGKQVLLEFTNGNSTVTLTGNWQRFTTTGTNTVNVAIKRATSQQAASVLAWGAQLETGSVATSYIPTTAGTGSRSADVVSVSGAVSGSIGQTEGTIYIEFVQNNNVSLNRVIAIDNGTNSDNGFDIVTTAGGNIRITYRVLGVAQCDITTSVVTAVGVTYKVAFAYAQNNFVIYVNGIERGTNSSGNTTLTPSRIILGGRSDATGNIRARAVALYTTRLTDAELATLTTT